MKKIISIIMCVMLIFGILAMPTSAATNYCSLFQDKIGTLRWAIEIGDHNANVTEGSAFPMAVIMEYGKMLLGNKYYKPEAQYIEIPEDEFEALIKSDFAVVSVDAMRAYVEYVDQNQQGDKASYYDADKKKYMFIAAGGLGDSTVYVVRGYIKNGNKYTVYSDYVDQAENEFPDNAVEGKDYIVYNGNKCKILDGLKNIVETDGRNVKFHSWEKTSSIPGGLITPTTVVEDPKPESKPTTTTSSKPTTTTSSKPTTTTSSKPTAAISSAAESVESSEAEKPAEETVTVAQTETAKLEADKNVFPEDTVVKVEEIKETEALKPIKEALKEVSEKFVAYEITAQSKNVSVQPNGKVKATFDIPEGYDLERVAVFFVDKNGKAEKLITAVNKADSTAIAELSHFSTYVVAETNEDVADTDSSKGSGALVWILIVVGIALIGGLAAVYFLVIKKKRG